MPVHVRYSHCWRLKTWDGFMIPRPFSSVEVTFDELQSVAETSDDDPSRKNAPVSSRSCAVLQTNTPRSLLKYHVPRVAQIRESLSVPSVPSSLALLQRTEGTKRTEGTRISCGAHGYFNRLLTEPDWHFASDPSYKQADMILIDGKAIAGRITDALKGEVAALKMAGVAPGLAVVLVGDDPASRAYVRSKDKMCQALGMHSVKHEVPASFSQTELLALVAQLNRDSAIHGILVQAPLPSHLDSRAVVDAIDPRKDVDGLHPINAGKLVRGDDDAFVPCTPLGCQRLLLESGIDPRGAHVVVLGRSMLVGKPLAALLSQKGRGGDATVTLAHSQTRNLPAIARTADILVAAIGRPEFVTAEFVRDAAVVLDVGINRVPASSPEKSGKLVGDVAFDQVAAKCKAITPVPGGVGPMTIAMLMANTVASCRRWLEG